MEAVAAAAGVSKATLYRRYHDKRELVAAALGTLSADLPELPDTDDITSDLVELFLALLRQYERMRAFAINEGLLVEASKISEHMELFQRAVIAPRRAVIQRLLERAVTRGQLGRELDCDMAVDCVTGPLFLRKMSGLPVAEEWVRGVVQQVLQGLLPRHRSTSR